MAATGPRCRMHQAVRYSSDQRRRSGRTYDRRFWRRLRLEVLTQQPWCAYCEAAGKTVPATEVDHIDGDSTNNARENLRPLCKRCHSAKTAQHDGAFGRARG